MSWESLFDRASTFEVSVESLLETLRAHRGERDGSDTEPHRPERAASTASDAVAEPIASSPARVVADADVLAADLFGADDGARGAIEALWRHSWIELVASDALVADAEAVIAALGDEPLASTWGEQIHEWRFPVAHPRGDHPALGSAYRGGAMHVLSLDPSLTSSNAATALNERFPVSVREPAAFEVLFDAESLYADVESGPYPGPDRSPRSTDRTRDR
ncbi:MAG: DUF7384 family protein [Halobacteriota archaeon]